MSTVPRSAERPPRRLSPRGLVVFVAAAVAVIIAAVVGVQGLLATPVSSVAADGTATLHGTWEPYSCNHTLCEGYVQAGGRSVFLVLPTACAEPARAAEITVRAKPDASLGNASYRAGACPS